MKIEGFNGKFQQANGGVVAAPPVEAPHAETTKKPIYKPENIHSFNLKKALEETKEKANDQQDGQGLRTEDNRVKAQSEFTAADVTAALESYITTLGDEDKATKIALSSHAPKVEGCVITLEVDNDFLLTRTMDLHPVLLSFLM